jgi:hypothetical protein
MGEACYSRLANIYERKLAPMALIPKAVISDTIPLPCGPDVHGAALSHMWLLWLILGVAALVALVIHQPRRRHGGPDRAGTREDGWYSHPQNLRRSMQNPGRSAMD